MILIENPIDFFGLLDSLTYKINIMVEDQITKSDSDVAAVCFRTDKVYKEDFDGIPIIKSFSLFKKEDLMDKESEEYEVLRYYSLCCYSFNNKDYYYEIDDNKELSEYIENYDQQSDCVLYVCDLTHTYYCKITNDTKKYFCDKLGRQLTVDEMIKTEDYLSPPEQKMFYYCYYPYDLYTITKESGDFVVPFDNLPNFSLLNLYDDDCEYIELTNVDFFGEIEDRKVFIQDFFADSITTLKADYVNTLSSIAETDFELFGEKIQINSLQQEADRMNILASFIVVISDLFYHPISSYGTSLEEAFNDAYVKLVDKTIAESITYDGVAKNLLTMMEEYYINLQTSVFNQSFHDNINTYFIYELWKYLNSNAGIMLSDLVFNYLDPEIIDEQVKELPLVNYIDNFLAAMLETAEKAKEYTDNVNNFEAGFVGGGFGLKGAAKGILAASIASAVTETAYSVYQACKFNKGSHLDILNEFMQTDQSKMFIKELIIFDFKTLYINLLDKFVFLYKQFLKRDKTFAEKYGGVVYFDGLYASFKKSSQLYLIALAKHMHLSLVPQYGEIKDEYELTPKQLLEKAILEYPYDYKYYEKYLEFGGKMTDNLKLYADLHMININDLYEREKAHLEREKAEKEEQERKQEEERKKKEEQSRKALEKIHQVYQDDLVLMYPELFSALSENPLFSEYCDKTFKDHSEIINTIFVYMEKYHKNVSTNLYPVNSTVFQAKQRNLISVYGYDKINQNSLLFFYDNTVFGSAKDGFVVTKDYFCNRNSFSSPVVIPIKEIQKISVRGSDIYINDTIRVDIALCKLESQEIMNILTFCFCNLLLLSKETSSASSGLLQKPEQLEDSSSWRCTCGNQNPNMAKFCSQCGSKKVELSKEWICAHCKTKNMATAKFCMECGNPKKGMDD